MTSPYYGSRTLPARRRYATVDEAFKKGQIRRYGTVKVTFDDVLAMVRKMPKRAVTQALKQVTGLLTPAEATRLKRLVSLKWTRQPLTDRVLAQRHTASIHTEPDSQPSVIYGTQDTIDEEPELLPPVRRIRKKKKSSKK